jgi:predicted MFS family arabinose efflux permease
MSGVTTNADPSPAATASRRGVLAQLRPTPRFGWLMAVYLVAAVSVGARETVRVDYASETLNGELGVGVVAVVFAISLALGSVMNGRRVDAHDARPVLIVGTVASALLQGVNAVILLRGPMPLGWLIASTAIEAALFGILATSLLKVQAAIVQPGTQGAAETVSIVRSGIGMAIGAVLAGFIGDPVVTQFVTASLTLGVALAAAVVVWPVTMPTVSQTSISISEVVDVVRSSGALRRTVTVDLILAFVLPTQFIALALADQDEPELVSLAFAASLLGVLVGRLALMATGIRGNLARRLTSTYLAFTALTAFAAPALVGGWILDQRVLVVACPFVGSALLAYAQNLPIALIQQQVPEHVRGSLSGFMQAARNLLIAGAAVGVTALTTIYSASVLALAIAIMLGVGFLVAGRFRGLVADP